MDSLRTSSLSEKLVRRGLPLRSKVMVCRSAALERTLIVTLLCVVLSLCGVAEAAVPCKEITCSWCLTPRVVLECSSFCHKCGNNFEVRAESSAIVERDVSGTSRSTENSNSNGDESSSAGFASQSSDNDVSVERELPPDSGTSHKSSESAKRTTLKSKSRTMEAPRRSASSTENSSARSASSSSRSSESDLQGPPTIPLDAANSRFKTCCEAVENLNEGCSELCRYDVTSAEVQGAVLSTKCSLEHFPDVLKCASDGHDNTGCCEPQGVFDGRPQCRPFCSTGNDLG